jgi:type VII secretion integral membrane protein EccD
VGTQLNLGLARLTIAASRRRIDLVVPDQVPLAALMPTLLNYVGESLAERSADAAGGWTVRRADGSALRYDATLAAQQVRDGEVLYMVPRDDDWPEPEYDDIALAVADSSRKLGPRWHGGNTRLWALLATTAALAVGLAVLLTSGPNWLLPSLAALGVAGLGLATGTVLSRALGDSAAGAVVAANGLPYAFLGGLLLLAGREDLRDLGAPHLLVGSTFLLLVALVAVVSVADGLWVFVGGIFVALAGLLAGVFGLASASAAGAAAIVACVAIATIPMSGALSVRMGKLPMPHLPQTPHDLLKEPPQPAFADIHTAVMRTGELFAGLLLGVAVTLIACDVVLVGHGGVAAPLFVAVVSALCLIRARVLPLPRQRVPVLVSGVVGATLLIVGFALGVPASIRPAVLYLGVLPAALVAVAAGITYSRRRPSPQMGRIADILDILLTLSLVPVAAAVLGLYGVVRALAG